MYLESMVISVMSTREGYTSLQDNVRVQAFDKEVAKVLKYIGKYYRKFSDHACIDTDLFKTLFYENAGVKKEEYDYYEVILSNINKEVLPEAVAGLTSSLYELDFSHKLTEIVQQYEAGEEIDIIESTAELLHSFERKMRQGVDACEVDADLESIIQEINNGTKLSWSIDPLAKAMPEMSTGDQIIFAARPGQGKTSFLLYNTARMAKCIPNERCILWLCNEGKGNKIKLGLYRTLLEADSNSLIKLGGKRCSDLVNKYGCGTEKFKIMNIHGMNVYQVEKLIQKHKPMVVVWDMLDNIKGFNNEARTDLRLEELYKWARECAVLYDFLSLPTSQTSTEAEGLPFPSQNMLKDSKTGKQGACDGIIIMGNETGIGKESLRYFHLAKPWKGAPVPGHDPVGRCVATFNGAKCLFNNVNALKE